MDDVFFQGTSALTTSASTERVQCELPTTRKSLATVIARLMQL